MELPEQMEVRKEYILADFDFSELTDLSNSLVMPYRIASMRKGWQLPGQLVRLNVGLEDPQDLIADIERAFAAM